MKNSLKIGVVTHSWGTNYGGTLQCFALLKILREKFHSLPEYVHYMPDENVPSLLKRIKNILRFVFSFFIPRFIRRRQRGIIFQKFRKLYCPSSPYFKFYNQIIPYAESYDLCIAGSDQVWNPYYNGSHPWFMLEFVPSEKRFAYAASIGVSDIPIPFRERYREALSKFSAISTREETGAEIVRKLTGMSVQTVLDPVLLLSRDQWNEFTLLPSNVQIPKEPYILCYALGDHSRCLRIAHSLARKCGKKILWIFSGNEKELSISRDNCLIFILNADPISFANLIKNADYVVTNSFHGTLFSIIFHTEFFTCERSATSGNSMHSRLTDLFAGVHLSHRLISDDATFDEIETIDYSYADSYLERRRNESFDYLQNVIDGMAKERCQLNLK